MPTKTFRGRLLAVSAAAALILSACGGQGSPAPSVTQRPIVVLRQLAVCFRANGLPDFPDPVVSGDGVARFPDSAPRTPVAAQNACRSIADQLPATYSQAPPVLSPARFRQLLLFAGCMRAHGVPDWPDPGPQGQFPIGPGIQKVSMLTAERACARLRH
jgi:hypothetical protein